jgi:hypothetical protein
MYESIAGIISSTGSCMFHQYAFGKTKKIACHLVDLQHSADRQPALPTVVSTKSQENTKGNKVETHQ